MVDNTHRPPSTGHSCLTRVLELSCLLVVIVWVANLGGVALRPVWKDEITNDMGKLFNLHPLFQTAAFAVLMAEALQSWRSPIIPGLDRIQRKVLHVVLQTLALLTMYVGVTIAYLSHSLKRPTPVPNFYSTHSWLGLLTLGLATAQMVAGLAVFVGGGSSPTQRKKHAPLHTFIGRATFVIGLATMMVGIQEKATFVQIFGKLSVRAPAMWLPACLNVLLVALGAAVLYSHTPSAAATEKPSVFGLLEHDALEEQN